MTAISQATPVLKRNAAEFSVFGWRVAKIPASTKGIRGHAAGFSISATWKCWIELGRYYSGFCDDFNVSQWHTICWGGCNITPSRRTNLRRTGETVTLLEGLVVGQRPMACEEVKVMDAWIGGKGYAPKVTQWILGDSYGT